MEQKEKLDYAFLDVEMREMSGIELAKELKELCPSVRILFVSAYNQYACEAFQLHAKGYILKPATEDLIVEALDSMEIEWRQPRKIADLEEGKCVSVHTFGNFDVFVENEPVQFERSKSKELFAYLIDRCGAGSSTAEIAAVLWEDVVDRKKLKNSTQTVIHSMMQSLKQRNIEDVVVKKWNYLAVDISKVECDYYKFLEGDAVAVNSYMGEYMSNYSWAEMTTASLLEDKMAQRNNIRR
jgi:two-component SAPR family response regulator